MDFVRRVTLKRAEQKKWAKKLPEFRAGDTVSVHVRIKEGEKERTQVYRGICIKIQGAGFGKTFTVRKISAGVGVERTFPFASPNVEKVEVINRGQVRRSRLFFLRNLKGRAGRLKSELVVPEENTTAPANAETAETSKAEAAPAKA
jgi:large subunit ribosomal protein L19